MLKQAVGVMLLLAGLIVSYAVWHGPIHYPFGAQDVHDATYTIYLSKGLCAVSIPAIFGGLWLLGLGNFFGRQK